MTTEPKDVDENLGIIAVTTTDKVQIPDVVSVMKGEIWEQSGHFTTVLKISGIWAIAINHGGDVALTNASNS